MQTSLHLYTSHLLNCCLCKEEANICLDETFALYLTMQQWEIIGKEFDMWQ